MKIKLMAKNLFLNLFYTCFRFLNFDKQTTRIICYHSISTGNKYSVDIQRFKKDITVLKRYFAFVSLDEGISGKKSSIPSICLTIDDGYKNVLEVVPFLKENNIPVALFVLSKPKSANKKELDNSDELLRIKDVKFLKKLGWEIGCHSATHADFSSISAREIKEEVIDSKKSLEKKLGFTIKYFAYPKGSYSENVVSAVKKAKYKAAFATMPGLITSDANKYSLPRFVMEKEKIFSIPASFSAIVDVLRKKIIL